MMKMVYTLFKTAVSSQKREPWEEPLFKPYMPDAVKEGGKAFGRYLLYMVIFIGIALVLMALATSLASR